MVGVEGWKQIVVNVHDSCCKDVGCNKLPVKWIDLLLFLAFCLVLRNGREDVIECQTDILELLHCQLVPRETHVTIHSYDLRYVVDIGLKTSILLLILLCQLKEVENNACNLI